MNNQHISKPLLCTLLFSFLCAGAIVSAHAAAQGIAVRVENPTRYTVYFDEDQRIEKNASGTVRLFTEGGALSRGFDISYAIPLSDTVDIFCKGDRRTIRENQNTLTITEPNIQENYGTFLAIQNKADSAITFISGGTVNQFVEQKGSPAQGNHLARTALCEFSPGKTAVFDISEAGAEGHKIQESLKDAPLALPQPLQKNHLYTFAYTARGAELIDARPLHRVGEGAWTKPILKATGVMPVTGADNVTHFFAVVGGELFRYTYDSAGNAQATGAPVPSGKGFSVTDAAPAPGGFLVAGYEKEKYTYTPVARIVGNDGVTRRVLHESDAYASARYLCAAPKDSTTWLLAGDGAQNGSQDSTAYARLVRDENGSLTVLWERGGKDFAEKDSSAHGVQYGDIKSAAYDKKRDCWVITGEYIEKDLATGKIDVTGAYLARINGSGVPEMLDSFDGMTFYKVLVDAQGTYFLAGEEKKKKETYAALIRIQYAESGSQRWKLSNQPASHSYYYTAFLDSAKNQIILAGTQGAKKDSGQGGIPFIDAADAAEERLIWREQLSAGNAPAFKGVNLITAFAPGPDYGFVLALSGLASGSLGEPWIIARINSQGKFFQ